MELIQLTVASGGGRSIAALALQVLDELHARVRKHGMELIRTEGVDFGREDETHTFTLDPPAAGTLTVDVKTAGISGSNTVAFTVHGIGAITLAGPIRAVANQIRQHDPRAVVSLTRDPGDLYRHQISGESGHLPRGKQ